MTWTPEMQRLWEAVKPPEEPPANCQDCEYRNGHCAEYASLNPGHLKVFKKPYNREFGHMYKKEAAESG